MATKVVVEGSSVTALQLKDFFRQISDGSITGKVMQAVLDHRNPWEEKNYTFLAPHRTVTVGPLAKPFNPKEFFQTGNDLWVSDEFAERILPAAQTAESSEAVSLQSFNLAKNANDKEIRSELPENHLTELWQIAELIVRQPNGKDGDLLNNGYINIFYVEGIGGGVFAVVVHWGGGRRQWNVFAWRLGGVGEWNRGSRAFSRN